MSHPVRIPADVDREDRVLGSLTARQLMILALAGLLLYAGYLATQTVAPIGVYLVFAIPVGAVVALVALGQRDGLSLDRLVLAALRQRLTPRHRVAAPEGVRAAPEWLTALDTNSATAVSPVPLRLPAQAVTEAGVIDLGRDGLAVVATCSTVNFQLNTATEQEGLVAVFARYLHSLSAPVQILVRAERLSLAGQIAELRATAGGLPHPALENAAHEHADYLTQLAAATVLLRRQVLLILREPVHHPPGSTTRLPLIGRRTRHLVPDEGAVRAAEARLVRRLAEATELLAPGGITVTALDAGQATTVLAAACDPDSLIPPTAGMAGANDVITTTPSSWDETAFGPTALPHADDDEGIEPA
ncbi:PrgI family protein [Kutzneria sp. NPDC052558]|uniref:PrgI family protein n=1 Tax=Kutzneria sp. NPDC052558 TaxID=3364121 RepID=UPI0037CB2DA1